MTDRKLAVDDGTGEVDYYVADVVSQSDYFPFGMLLPNNSDEPDAADYRYGFNGMEKDDEVRDLEGTFYSTEFRQYDARVGRWLSIDPVVHHEFSPYSAFDNNPIVIMDPSGADGEEPGDPRSTFYSTVGEACINTVTAGDNEVNKFKALYLVAQIRTESGFENTFANNPFNIKNAGDLGKIANPKTPNAGAVWGNFSTMEKGIEAGLDLMERKYSDAYSALTDDNKTFDDFAAGIDNNNDGKKWGTDTELMKKVFQGVVADYESMYNKAIEINNQKIVMLEELLANTPVVGPPNVPYPSTEILKASLEALKEENNQYEADLEELQEFKKNEGIE